MVEVENLSLAYNDRGEALKDIDFKIRDGECILLTGESGSGKSSIINSINGLATKYENAALTGKVSCFEKNIEELELYEISMMISSVFQNPKTHFFNVNTTLELLFYLENIGLTIEAMEERMENMLKLFPIEHLLNRDIFKLSGGEKQILCVAACYISGAKVIVLDEPSSNLDSAYIEVLSNMLKALKEKGLTLIISEHRIYYLMEFIDYVFIINKGKIVEKYTRDEFLEKTDEDLVSLGLRSKTKTNLQVSKTNSNWKTDGNLQIRKILYPMDKENRLKMENISFKLGKIYGIVGKNGCGKSTFSHCFIGLERKCKDEIFLDGKKLSKKDRLFLSGLVMQDVNHQLFTESVEEELKLGNENLSKEMIDEVLKKLNLEAFRSRHPMSLSGGQKQRVAVASVLCKTSQFVFFDEPTSGMDYKNMVRISNLIKKVKKKDNIIFIISHDIEFLNMTVDEIIDMEEF